MRIISGKHRGTKLFTLEGINTRPTLDRVKEPLFSILNFDIEDSTVLDLFAGSGALGLEALSRGAREVILCDNSTQAIHIIEKNVDKLKANSNVKIIKNDYLQALEILKSYNKKMDLIFLDPPYKLDFIKKACQKISEYNLLDKNGKIIVETDRRDDIFKEIDELGLFDIYDERKYGRVYLFFLCNK